MNPDVARKTTQAKPATDVISQKQTTNGNGQVATAHRTKHHAEDSTRSSGDRTHSDDASAHSGEGHSPGKPTGVVSAASGGKPTGTESTAQRVGQQPGSPAGLELTDDEKKLLGQVAKGLTVKNIAMRRGARAPARGGLVWAIGRVRCLPRRACGSHPRPAGAGEGRQAGVEMDCVHDKHDLRRLYECVEGEEARGGAGDYAGA